MPFFIKYISQNLKSLQIYLIPSYELLNIFLKTTIGIELKIALLLKFGDDSDTLLSQQTQTMKNKLKYAYYQEEITIFLLLPSIILYICLYKDLYNIKLLMSNQQKQDNEDIMINAPEGFDSPLFCWDVNKTSHKIQLDPECLRAKSTEGNGFKTTMGTEIFTQGGRYYFEIFINKGQLIKIGVCRPSITNLEEAFSDGVHGWAIYNGQTRHNSNSTGPNYGSPLVTGDIIGVALDMVEGTLGYYRNETYWGVAFKDEELKKGEMVASVSPIYNNDTFTLRNMIKQD